MFGRLLLEKNEELRRAGRFHVLLWLAFPSKIKMNFALQWEAFYEIRPFLTLLLIPLRIYASSDLFLDISSHLSPESDALMTYSLQRTSDTAASSQTGTYLQCMEPHTAEARGSSHYLQPRQPNCFHE